MCVQGIHNDFKCIYSYQLMIIKFKLTNMSIFLILYLKRQEFFHHVTKIFLNTAEEEGVKPRYVTKAEYKAESRSASDYPALGPLEPIIPIPYN